MLSESQTQSDICVTFDSSFHWSRLLFYGSAKFVRFGLINLGGVVRMRGEVIIQGLQLALGGCREW